MNKLSVIGLGKLGACMAACFASKGFETIGIDINKEIVDAINDGKAPLAEPRLQELITASGNKLRGTQDFEEAIHQSDISFLVTPTPSKPDGNFSDKYLSLSLEPLATALKKSNKRYHLFVIASTVSPGTTEESLIPLIEKFSGRKLNEGVGVCYCPEFMALGSVINDFLNPDLVLIGESDKSAGDQLAKLYKAVCENRPYIARMSIISAEITKISLNSYITMKIGFANTLANICERILGTDIDAITKALGTDKRISPYYLKGGPAYGGPCFPRDNRAFVAFAKKCGYEAKLAKTADEVNEYQREHLLNLVLKQVSEAHDKRVSILGLAYKANTPVIEESAAINIINELTKKDVDITVYDPLALKNARATFRDRINYASSVRDCLSRSALCVITTPWDEFKTIDHTIIVHDPTTIIDCWRMLDPRKLGKKVKYIAIGRPSG